MRFAAAAAVRRKRRGRIGLAASTPWWNSVPGCRRDRPDLGGCGQQDTAASGALRRLEILVALDRREDNHRVAGPTVLAGANAFSLVCPTGQLGTPLLRFCSLQHIPAAWRCPELPASGRSRFGVKASATAPDLSELSVRQSPLRSFAHPGEAANRPPRLNVARRGLCCLAADRERHLTARESGERDLVGTAKQSTTALMGFDPSQFCSCPRVGRTSPSSRAHMPLLPSDIPAGIWPGGRSPLSGNLDRKWQSATGREHLGTGFWALTPRAIRTGPALLPGDRPILPWALPLSGLEGTLQVSAMRRSRKTHRNHQPPDRLPDDPIRLGYSPQGQSRLTRLLVRRGAAVPASKRVDGADAGPVQPVSSPMGSAPCLRFFTCREMPAGLHVGREAPRRGNHDWFGFSISFS
jgi:hypothetical protein